jgi:hypothetical protein
MDESVVPRLGLRGAVAESRFVPKGLIESVRKAAGELAEDSPIFGITTVEKTLANSARQWSFLSKLLGLFAAAALLPVEIQQKIEGILQTKHPDLHRRWRAVAGKLFELSPYLRPDSLVAHHRTGKR